MGWEENIKQHQFTSDQSREEAAKNGAKGGVKSGQSRRQKRMFMDTARKVLKMKPDIDRKTLAKMGYTDKADPQIRLIIVLSLAQKAMKGDAKSAALLMEMVGEDSASIAAQERIELEREKMMLSVGGAMRNPNGEQDDGTDPDEQSADEGPMIDLSKLTDDELRQYEAVCQMLRDKCEVKRNEDAETL